MNMSSIYFIHKYVTMWVFFIYERTILFICDQMKDIWLYIETAFKNSLCKSKSMY